MSDEDALMDSIMSGYEFRLKEAEVQLAAERAKVAELERQLAEAKEDFEFLNRHRVIVEDPSKDPDNALVFWRIPGASDIRKYIAECRESGSATLEEAIRAARKERG